MSYFPGFILTNSLICSKFKGILFFMGFCHYCCLFLQRNSLGTRTKLLMLPEAGPGFSLAQRPLLSFISKYFLIPLWFFFELLVQRPLNWEAYTPQLGEEPLLTATTQSPHAATKNQRSQKKKAMEYGCLQGNSIHIYVHISKCS